MKSILKFKRIFLLGLLPISYILILLAKYNKFFAETIYARHIYKWISQALSLTTGLLPFSLAEIFILLLPFMILFILIRYIIHFIKEKQNRKTMLLKGILNFFCFFGILVFSFVILAGINYYRRSFTYYSGLEIQDSSIEELYSVTEDLANTANELRKEVPKTDENGVFQLSKNVYEIASISNKAFQSLSKEYPVLSGYYGSPKPVLISKAMSSTEITGIFIPFTMEANVNVDVPDYSIPATMLHELAHLRGFMREDEANYIAYLAGIESDNIELKYSAVMLAFTTASNALYDQDPMLDARVSSLLSEEVRKDLRAGAAYWQSFDNEVISTISNKINDTYLKVNNQSDGVKSYGRMVDLLIARYRNN